MPTGSAIAQAAALDPGPSTSAAPAPAAPTLGLYFSVPFCRSKCTYCNFASGVYPASDHDRYVQRLIADLRAARARAARLGLHLPELVDSVYFGGGTPVLLSPQNFQAIFAALRSEFALAPDAEITIECAPAQLPDATLAALVDCGANRFSLGVQSFLDRECAVSGRLHRRADVLADLARLRAAGVHNLSLDLLAGLAGQTLASWRESLNVLLETDVPHASVYMLEIDEDSHLGRELLDGGARYHADLVPGDDAIATMYETAIETLAAAGLAQYEISNFARPGHASRHNLRYWSRQPYLGFGLDAASMLFAAAQSHSHPAANDEPAAYEDPPAALRFTTTADLAQYLAPDVPADNHPPLSEQTWLSAARQIEETWFLGLRRNSGVSVAALEQRFSAAVIEPSLRVARRLVERGLLTCESAERFALTPRGRLISNEVFAEFLAD